MGLSWNALNLLSIFKFCYANAGKYYGMDDDGYEHAVEDECLEQSAHQLPEGGTYNSQSTYNPYHLNMGQLTVYR